MGRREVEWRALNDKARIGAREGEDEGSYAYNGFGNGTPLSASTDGVAGVFDIDAGDVGARGGEEGGADAESGVGTWEQDIWLSFGR